MARATKDNLVTVGEKILNQLELEGGESDFDELRDVSGATNPVLNWLRSEGLIERKDVVKLTDKGKAVFRAVNKSSMGPAMLLEEIKKYQPPPTS